MPLYSGEAERARRTISPSIGASARRDLALVGHETFCYDDLTVRENLRFAARAPGTGADADAALERLGLTRVGDVAHRRLSAGQRRRLALAVALSRATRASCCSTSPTPASTRKAARCSTDRARRAGGGTAPC